MNRDDIIKMAQEAGFGNYAHEARTMFERFFHMAQAAERARLQSAAECYRMCEHKGVCHEKAKSNETN